MKSFEASFTECHLCRYNIVIDIIVKHFMVSSLDKAINKFSVCYFNAQFILIVAASSVGEELFYRAAVQVCYYE